MNKPTAFSESVRQAFQPTARAVVGLVDSLLALCREQELQLDWHDDVCQVRSIRVEPEESAEVPLAKSVFRAVLARLAALCNERHPASVTPYGGEGELAIGTNPPIVCRIVFANTPSEQRAHLTRIKAERANGKIQKRGELLDSMTTKD